MAPSATSQLVCDAGACAPLIAQPELWSDSSLELLEGDAAGVQ